ncbi:MAG: iron-containing alcohol dehydrogenase [Treponema sp.]|nr:iron-containing alcohol dehydrogenase [Treponema sp.]
MSVFSMYVPTRILFGAGRLNELHEQKLFGKKALIVISCGKSTRANGYLDRTVRELKTAGIDSVVFDRIQPNPLKSTVEEGAAFSKQNGCDFIVALGGGSVMDSAKAIAIMATNPGDLWDYAMGGTGKSMPVAVTPLPIVAVTTTAGTGSEVDGVGVITNEITHEKMGVGGECVFPKLAVVDPELMATVPAKLTAYQGFDALFHSLEGYISRKANLMSDMYALTAVENAGTCLAHAVKDGSDTEAREHMAFANTLSGVVMDISGCTSEHSMEHALSAYHEKLEHGAGLIMLSKSYFGYFAEHHVCDDRLVKLAQALGMKNASDPADIVEALDLLQKACGVDGLKMSDYGIVPDEFETFSKNAHSAMARLFKNDRIELDDAAVIGIYQKAYR